jgi:hypothetical protein
VTSTALAQSFPQKPARRIVPFPPGGATDMPAISEALPGYQATAWVARRIVQLPDIAHRLRDLGATAEANSPAEFAQFVKWRRLVATAKIQIEQ